MTADEFVKKPFDFLVVGGGTAGLAVAARLSENPDFTIGVLEAGEPAFGDGSVDMPGLAGSALGTGLDWKFETTAQPGLDGRTLPWARGKVLGGSSALNYMTWNRASRQDYDDWAELGNAGWGWDDLLSVFFYFCYSVRIPCVPAIFCSASGLSLCMGSSRVLEFYHQSLPFLEFLLICVGGEGFEPRRICRNHHPLSPYTYLLRRAIQTLLQENRDFPPT